MKILINVNIEKNNNGSLFIFWKWNQNQHLNESALNIMINHFKNAQIDEFKSDIVDEYEQNKTYAETLIYDSFLKTFKHIKNSVKLYHFQDCLNLFDEFNQHTFYYYKKDENLNLKEINKQLKNKNECIIYSDLFKGYELTHIFEYLDINKIWLRISKDYQQFNILTLLNVQIDWTGHIF